jgi:Amt family ammonium transporter
VGALSAHGLAGIWGTLACGLFTNPDLAKFNAVGDPGLVYTGSFHQLGVQALGILVAFSAVFAMSMATFFIIKKTYGLRVTAEEEDAGLDITEHGMYGYPEQFIPEPELIGYGALPADTKGYRPEAAPVRAATGTTANRDGVTA